MLPGGGRACSAPTDACPVAVVAQSALALASIRPIESPTDPGHGSPDPLDGVGARSLWKLGGWVAVAAVRRAGVSRKRIGAEIGMSAQGAQQRDGSIT